jgi:tripeptidyl-peptidase-2
MPSRNRFRLTAMIILTAASVHGQEPGFDPQGLQPRIETGSQRFLDAHPEFDGRGVVVAIFDTGIDPGAPGLQFTPNGEPKIIDMVDGTGSGDVDTSTRRIAIDDKLIGVSGRSLLLNPAWTKANKQFHVGMKPAFELFPGELIPRIKSARQEKQDLDVERLAAGLRIRSQKLASQGGDARKAEKKRIDAQLESLTGVADAKDMGPVYDCVVFRLDGKWRAVVDTDEDGDLRDEIVLTNYRDEHKFGTFGAESGYNFAVNIYEQGNLLSLIADTGAHGTHVAGIVGAHFPGQPELDGVAPGVQFVSVKIGDTRLAGMETASGLVRGLIAAKRAGCDLINMSFGEPSRSPNHGRVPEHFADFVNEHGIIYISSAGNAGPALSTAGAPGATLSAAIGVGAYISPGMMRSEYVLDGNLPEMPYTWTSRGPTFDGDMAVDIFAPGGAVSPVPNWTQQRVLRMNGTSMASPNACGSVALILSGLKKLSVPYNVQSVRRALANTARSVPNVEVFAQGPGLLQVDSAFEYLKTNVESSAERLEVKAEVNGHDRGIYLREANETNAASTHTVKIAPVFPESAKNQERVDFELRLSISTTADWVTTGHSILLTHGGQSFRVQVDPTQLQPGVHTAWVLGHDATNEARGPLVRLPITVLVKDEVKSDTFKIAKSVNLSPGHFHRTFVQVPPGAQWADLRLKREGGDVPALFVVHAVQVLDDRNYRDAEFQQYLNLDPNQKVLESFSVTGGRVMELCVCQYWSVPGPNQIDFELTFRGVVPADRHVTLVEGTPGARVDVTNFLGDIELAAKATLKTHRHLAAPTGSKVTALSSERDRLPDGRVIHRLELSYVLEQTKAGSVTLGFPRTDDWLYDSPFGGHLWTVHDENGRLVYTDDIWSDPVRLAKGKYAVALVLRHENPELLSDYESMPMSIDRPLGSPINIAISNGQMSLGSSLPSSLDRGAMSMAYFHTPSDTPAGVVAGDQLIGSVTYAGAPATGDGATGRPGGFPVTMFVTTGGSPNAGGSAADAAAEDDLSKAVAELEKLDTEGERKNRLEKIVAAAEKVVSLIDQDAVASNLGRRVDEDDADAVKVRKKMEKNKSHLVDAFYRRGRAIAYMELPDVVAKKPIENAEEHAKRFEAAYKDLAQWADPKGDDHFLLAVRRHRRAGEFGEALQLLNKHMGGSSNSYWLYKKQRDILNELGWKTLADRASTNLTHHFPDKIRELSSEAMKVSEALKVKGKSAGKDPAPKDPARKKPGRKKPAKAPQNLETQAESQ